MLSSLLVSLFLYLLSFIHAVKADSTFYQLVSKPENPDTPCGFDRRTHLPISGLVIDNLSVEPYSAQLAVKFAKLYFKRRCDLKPISESYTATPYRTIGASLSFRLSSYVELICETSEESPKLADANYLMEAILSGDIDEDTLNWINSSTKVPDLLNLSETGCQDLTSHETARITICPPTPEYLKSQGYEGNPWKRAILKSQYVDVDYFSGGLVDGEFGWLGVTVLPNLISTHCAANGRVGGILRFGVLDVYGSNSKGEKEILWVYDISITHT